MKIKINNDPTEALVRVGVIVAGLLLLLAFDPSVLASKTLHGVTVRLTSFTSFKVSSAVNQDPAASPDARKRKVGDGSTSPQTPTSSATANTASGQSSDGAPATSQPTETSKPTQIGSRRNRKRTASRSVDTNAASVEPTANSVKPQSVWAPPANLIAPPTPQVAPSDFWTRVGARNLLHKFRVTWPWFLSVGVLALLGFVVVQLRSHHRKQKKAEYKRWSDEKIGPIVGPIEGRADFPELLQDESGSDVLHEINHAPVVETAYSSEDSVSFKEVEDQSKVNESSTGDEVRVGIASEEEVLQLDQEALSKTTGDLDRRRLELAEARRRADDEGRSLAEILTRIRADEDARHEVEEELQRLSQESHDRLQEERSRYEQTRRHVIEEQERVHTELSRLFAEENDRLQALEEEKRKADEELRRKVDQERRLRSEIDDLYRAGAEQRQRIEAETKRRAEAELKLREGRTRLHDVEEARINAGHAVEMKADAPATRSSIQPSVSPELVERLHSGFAEERSIAVGELAALGDEESFRRINDAFDDESPDVRSAAARALYEFNLDRAATYARALKEGNAIRRRRIGASVASSGLAHDAIANLIAQNRQQAYDAFSLLFLMAKAGELEPLIMAIENYPKLNVRIAVVNLLALTGQAEVVPGFQSLLADTNIPIELKTALNNAIHQLENQPHNSTSPVA